jgi:hypothetical protein
MGLPDGDEGQMGEPRVVFECRPWKQGDRVAWSILLIAAGTAAIGMGVLLAFLQRGGFRPGYLLCVPVGILGVFLGLLLVISALRNLSLRVAIFPNGLVRIRHRTVDICRWDDIESVYQRWPLNQWDLAPHSVNPLPYAGSSVPPYKCAIRRRDGKRLVFNERIEDEVKLGELIQQEAMRCLLPLALARFQEGKSVPFGKIAVDQNGFTSGKAFLPWDEVKEVKLGQGVLSVSREGKWLSWCKVDAESIPNLFVLLALLYKVDALRTLLEGGGNLMVALLAMLGEIPGVDH